MTTAEPTELVTACVSLYAEQFLRARSLPSDGLVVECDEPQGAAMLTVTVRVGLPGLDDAERAALLADVEHRLVHHLVHRTPVPRVRVTWLEPSG